MLRAVVYLSQISIYTATRIRILTWICIHFQNGQVCDRGLFTFVLFKLRKMYARNGHASGNCPDKNSC